MVRGGAESSELLAATSDEDDDDGYDDDILVNDEKWDTDLEEERKFKLVLKFMTLSFMISGHFFQDLRDL